MGPKVKIYTDHKNITTLIPIVYDGGDLYYNKCISPIIISKGNNTVSDNKEIIETHLAENSIIVIPRG